VDEQNQELVVTTKPKPGFRPGHPKFGGRQPGSLNIKTPSARAIAQKLKVDPLEWLLRAVATGLVTNADGTKTPISAANRIAAATAAVPYLHSKRSNVHVSGQIDSDQQVRKLDMLKIIMTPELQIAAEALAFAALEQEDAIVATPKLLG